MSDKKTRVLPEWRRLLTRAWSMRLWALSVILGSLELALPLVQDVVPPKAFAALALVAGIAGMVARVIPQPDLHGDEHAAR